MDGCITFGPWGGSQGKDWVYMPEGFIKKITIIHSGAIDRIRFQSELHTGETHSSVFGGNGGSKTNTICIDYPNEYLTSISGTIGHIGGSTVVMSLCLQTNQTNYGPYGCPYGSDSCTRFSYDGKGGMIVGFYGHANKHIDAIGVYVIPKSLELCRKMSEVGIPRESGPWGAGVGKPWDDGVFSHVKQVLVYMGESLNVIYGIQFIYAKRDGNSILSEMHGGRLGVCKTKLIGVDGEKEYLTRVSGFYGPVKEFGGLKGITSITFHTNKKIYGPYGEISGAGYVYFTSTSSPGKVVGFQGRSGDFLTAIGVHMEYF
ncbi:hypothetical protein LXL04_031595 [Taraxacum kok-saghyz]